MRVYISEFSKLSGLSIHTLRYYEKEGLLGRISRNASGKRLYSKTDLEWMTWIQRLKSTGMSLSDIKAFSKLRLRGEDSLGERKNMLAQHAETLKIEIAHLQGELNIVESKVKAYEERENNRLT